MRYRLLSLLTMLMLLFVVACDGGQAPAEPVEEEAPAVEARVDADTEEEVSEAEMAELEEALEALKQREMGG